ncbi:ankyrin repeat protein [Akanthomyces lecanii RCEF 1005]|uniref:Ankyrin repeat protein n=1 Tax=Akanthomyces lecanii RCEF 1005 TaxID=1081108 RepID=A0A167R849_CORDF|nr:ankyrin repeat protein [Akanthomyces lecanii RCEF 1005]
MKAPIYKDRGSFPAIALVAFAASSSAIPNYSFNAFAAAPDTCDAEVNQVPDCAWDALSQAAVQVCPDIKDDDEFDECGCTEDHVNEILSDASADIKTACGSTPVNEPFEVWRSCIRGDEPLPTSSTTTAATTTAQSSSSSNDSSTATSKSSVPLTLTSTFTTTTVYVVTSCGPDVADCNLGGFTTEVVDVTTTWCPLSETRSQGPDQPIRTNVGSGTPTNVGSGLTSDNGPTVPYNSGAPTEVEPPVTGASSRTQRNLGALIAVYAIVVDLVVSSQDFAMALTDGNDRTPLSYAAEHGYEAIVKLLVATDKVDVDAKDDSDRTLLSYAVKNGHLALVKLLWAMTAQTDPRAALLTASWQRRLDGQD